MKPATRFASAALATAALFAATTATAGDVVISQAYGGAGCAAAGCSTYDRDYIELFNKGASPVTLNGHSVQYHSKSGTGNWSSSALPASITIPPGGYYLVAEAAGNAGTGQNTVPTPDLDVTSGAIAMSATDGVVALVNTTTPLTCLSVSDCSSANNPAVVDLVGFGTAVIYRGSGAAPAPSKTTADLRAANGCTNSDDNSADFSADAPNPRNSSSPANACGGSGTPTDPGATGSANPATVAQGGSTTLTVLVTAGTQPTSTSYTVTVDLSAIGGGSGVAMTDGGPDGSGHEMFTYSATVGASTPAGAKSLPVAVVDDHNRTAAATIALTVTAPPVTIMAIQGHGSASPRENDTVTTAGNVVTAVGPKGFFMQDPLGDNDPTTSDGIYVYTGSAPAVALGNVVTVSGKVQEYNGSTELTNASISVTATSGATVAPYVLDDHPPTNDPLTGPCVGGNSTINPLVDGYQASNFACLDGMLVAMNEGVVTGATYGGGGTDAVRVGSPSGFYATLASVPRPARTPGVQFPGIDGHPEIPVWGGDPQILTVYYGGLGFAPGSDDPDSNDPGYDDPTDFVYHAGTTFKASGVIQGYKPSSGPLIYELYPRDMTTLDRVTAADNVKPVATSAAGTLTLGTQNFLHFFNNVADGSENNGAYNDTCAGTGASDTCPTAAQYAKRRTKWAMQVCDVLKAPVVLDAEEVENRSVLADLASSVHDRCGVQYVPYSLPGNDVSGINIGILVRDDVVVESVTQMFLDTMTTNCSSGTSCKLNDRPPVLMQATWNGYKFALLAIYNRSMSGLGNPTRPYIGPKRAEQAAQIAQIAQAWQSGATLAGAGNARQDASGTITQGPFDIVGDASVPLIVAGDFNAYQFSDGYADVTGMAMGTADRTRNLYWFDGNSANTDTPAYVAPSPTLIDSGIAADPARHYSFNFSGLTQEIDHILLSRRAWQDFVSISNAHGNSDNAEASGVILDDLTAARSGDHDGKVVTLAIDRIFASGFDGAP